MEFAFGGSETIEKVLGGRNTILTILGARSNFPFFFSFFSLEHLLKSRVLFEESWKPKNLQSLTILTPSQNSTTHIAASNITRELEDSIRNNEPLNRLQYCNLLSTDIDNEISIATKHIRQIYSSKSTNLQSTFKTDTIVSVMIIKSVEAMSANLFPDICKPLPEEKRMVDACDRVLALNSTKQKLDCFVERRMEILAPNLLSGLSWLQNSLATLAACRSWRLCLLLACVAVLRKLRFVKELQRGRRLGFFWH